MTAFRDWLASGAVAIAQPLTPGLITAGVHGGTGSPVHVGDRQRHLVLLTGSLGAAGTLHVYGHTDATGGGTASLGSIAFGAGTLAVAYEVASEALLGLGAGYTHLSAQVRVPTGGTCYASLLILSHAPRSAGGHSLAALGIGTIGTAHA